MNRKVILIAVTIVLNLLHLNAQPLNSIYENNTFVSFDKYIYSKDSSFHTSIRPYSVSELRNLFDYDSVKSSYEIDRFKNKKILNLIFNRNLISLKKKDYGFTIDPQVDFGTGYDTKNNRSSWINTRGIIVEGYIGRNFAFSTRYYENQAKVPLWINNYIAARSVMPGQGPTLTYGKDAVDYSSASGYISLSPSKYFNFQLGHGKQFLGDGYRSLILSDFSRSHPYFMITTSFWKIKYITLYSQFSHPDVRLMSSSGNTFNAKKYSTMQYLSFAPGKRLNISLFEAIIWHASDTLYHGGFDFNYLDPIIFLKSLESDIGASMSNALVALNVRFTAAKDIVLYGQFVFDEKRYKDLAAENGWYGNKYAWQAGLKSFDLFGIPNLNIQAEYNLIRPFMYSHFTMVQNYSTAKEPLAHPSGANTKEAVVIGKYNYKRLYLNFKYVHAAFGLDSAGNNYGKNIFLSYKDHVSYYGNFTTQGMFTTLNQIDMSVSFLINPATNMNLFVEATLRREKNVEMDNRYAYFNFGLRTSLRNLYYDFY